MSKQDIEKRLGFAAQGVKAEMAASDIIVKKDAQYIYYYPEDDDRATFPDDNGKGAYTVKSNRTGKPVSAKTYRSFQEAAAASNEMNEKLPPLKKAKSARPGAKAKFADAALNQIRNNAAISDKILTLVSKGLSVPQAIDSVLGEGTYKRIGSEVYDELKKAKSSRSGAKAKFEKEYVLWGLPKGETDRLHEKILSTQAKTPAQMEDVKKHASAAGWHSFRVQILDLSKPYKGFARPGVKAKMALTISTVGAKNLCYEALANLGELAKLAAETNSGWDFHVNVMINHVKDAMARMETKPTQAATDLDKAVDTLGMLKKIEPKRLNDIQKGSFKQLIGYVAKSLRDAKANIKVVTTASRPGAKAKMSATFIVAEAIFNAENAVRRGDNENARRWIKAAQDAMDETVVSTGMRSKLEQLVKRYKMSRPGAKAKMAAEIASDPRDKDFEKLKTLKGVVHQGKGFYIIPNKLMTPERRTKVKRSTQRYELSNMGDLVGWGTNHPNVNDYRLKDWAEAFA